jgi:hypothetical protein
MPEWSARWLAPRCQPLYHAQTVPRARARNLLSRIGRSAQGLVAVPPQTWISQVIAAYSPQPGTRTPSREPAASLAQGIPGAGASSTPSCSSTVRAGAKRNSWSNGASSARVCGRPRLDDGRRTPAPARTPVAGRDQTPRGARNPRPAGSLEAAGGSTRQPQRGRAGNTLHRSAEPAPAESNGKRTLSTATSAAVTVVGTSGIPQRSRCTGKTDESSRYHARRRTSWARR